MTIRPALVWGMATIRDKKGHCLHEFFTLPPAAEFAFWCAGHRLKPESSRHRPPGNQTGPNHSASESRSSRKGGAIHTKNPNFYKSFFWDFA
jgi:hypothetical protein